MRWLLLLVFCSCMGPKHVGTIVSEYKYDHEKDTLINDTTRFEFNSIIINGRSVQYDEVTTEGLGQVGYLFKKYRIKIIITKRDILVYKYQHMPNGSPRYTLIQTYSKLNR